jgi:hypothetical protein
LGWSKLNTVAQLPHSLLELLPSEALLLLQLSGQDYLPA